jgi:hypothetical protein
METDALRLVSIARLSDKEIETKCFQSKLLQDVEGEKMILSSLPLREAITHFESNPQRIATLLALVEKLNEERDPREGEYLLRLIDHPDVDYLNKRGLADLLDDYITRHLDEGTVDANAQFNQFFQKLNELSGISITTRGTCGSMLVDLGRAEEGKAILLDVLVKTGSETDKAYSNIFLALAEKQLGNLESARSYAQAAAKVGVECPALKRIADLLPEAGPRS